MNCRIGRFEIEVVYRTLPEDRGPTLHVYGPTLNNSQEEVLRFDCFEKEPHYHLAWSYKKTPFIRINSKDSFGWAIAQLKSNTNSLLQQAGAQEMINEELAKLKTLLPEIEASGRDLCDSV